MKTRKLPTLFNGRVPILRFSATRVGKSEIERRQSVCKLCAARAFGLDYCPLRLQTDYPMPFTCCKLGAKPDDARKVQLADVNDWTKCKTEYSTGAASPTELYSDVSPSRLPRGS